ncbi:hypothetical protein [Actinoallomurus soli]|uniref:hypothetical protein n=1 Tax=Actinoallomurus soli TaxID=2952535 RepID=UPI0020926490|nr:hypothetical protein [Actinoallomurus soli]MCO5973510.1 hypothetical protein [Actinoallomurus soli]
MLDLRHQAGVLQRVDLTAGELRGQVRVLAVGRHVPRPGGHPGQVGIILGAPRLGIPDIRQADAQGVNVYKDATAYPPRLGLAASFDREAAGEERDNRRAGLAVRIGVRAAVDESEWPHTRRPPLFSCRASCSIREPRIGAG